MRKMSLFFLAVLLPFCLAVSLTSCNNSNDETGSVTFVLDSSLVNRFQKHRTNILTLQSFNLDSKETESAGSDDGEEGEGAVPPEKHETFNVIIALRGDFSEEKTVSLTAGSAQTVSFSEIPVGNLVYAAAIALMKYADGESEIRAYGISGPVRIESGENSLDLKLKEINGQGEPLPKLYGTAQGVEGEFILAATKNEEKENSGLWKVYDSSGEIVSLGTYILSSDEANATLTELVFSPEYGGYKIASGTNSKTVSFSENRFAPFTFKSESGVEVVFGIKGSVNYLLCDEDGKITGNATINENGNSPAAGETMFDSACTEDELLAFIQSVVSVEVENCELSDIEVSYSIPMKGVAVSSGQTVMRARKIVWLSTTDEEKQNAVKEIISNAVDFTVNVMFTLKTNDASGTITLPELTEDVNIQIDSEKSSSEYYINNYRIALKATDKDGNDISNAATWTAELRYGGKDINTVSQTYYDFDASGATITTAVEDEVHTPLGISGTYQIFATATCNGETFSNTLSVTFPNNYYYDCAVGSNEYTAMMSKLGNITSKAVIKLTGTGEESVYENNQMTSENEGTMRKVFLALDCDADIDFSELEGISKVSDYEFNMYGSNKGGKRTLILPNTVESIGSHAFYYCKVLKNITLPEDLKTIGDYAFYGCTGLSSVHLPSNIEIIEEAAFYESSLTEVNIPESIKLIDTQAFSQLFSLVVTFDGECANLRALGNQAFYGNKELRNKPEPLLGTWKKFSTSGTSSEWTEICTAIKNGTEHTLSAEIESEYPVGFPASDYGYYYYKISD